jgi:hypothetical protein
MFAVVLSATPQTAVAADKFYRLGFAEGKSLAILARPGGTVIGIVMPAPELDAKERALPASRRTPSP